MRSLIKSLVTIVLILGFCRICFCETDAVQQASPQAKEESWEEKHADQSALELFNSSDIILNQDGSFTESSHVTYKILNELGKDIGEFPIAYDARYQKIKNIQAYTITPEGKKYRYEKIRDIDTSVEAFYSETRKKVISLRNVTPGNTIDIQYQVFNSQDAIKGEFFWCVGMFDTYPRKHQIVTLSIPEKFKFYLKDIHNPDIKPQIIQQNGRIIYKWEFKEDETYDEDLTLEEYHPPVFEFMPFTCISTMQDWSQLADWVRKTYSENIVSNKEIRSVVSTITKDKNSLQEKIEAIQKYLYENFRYVGIELGEYNLIPHRADEVFKNKFGDCKDQSILFITMLKELGVKAYPVLVRSFASGDIREFLPDPKYFDHVIVAVELKGKLYFVDPLIEGYRLNEIPYPLEKAYALVVADKDYKFLQLPVMDLKQKTTTNENICNLHSDGSVIIDFKFTLNRQDSINQRREMKLTPEKWQEDFKQMLENLTQGGNIMDYTVDGLKDEYGFLTVKVVAELLDFSKLYGPFMILEQDSTGYNQIFYRKQRKYPMQLEAGLAQNETTEYIIPKGFKFEYIPKNVKLSSDWMDISLKYVRKGRSIKKIKHSYFKSAVMPASRYQEVRDFMLKVDKELDNCIIIRKKQGFISGIWDWLLAKIRTER